MRLDVDYALVGGGLQNGLLALALRAAQPGARIAMVERGTTLGGNHTWCFHAGDLPASARPWIEPLIAQRWPGYHVAFPGLRRQLDSEYACITASRFHRVVSEALAGPQHHLLLEHDAELVEATRVVARQQTAVCEIDARGPDRRAFEDRSGFQKFVGLELRCAAPHGLTAPTLMDATVPQLDGFRFFYVLPLSADRLLVEDTVFSDSAYLDVAEFRQRIEAYAAAHGWWPAAIERQETGVLPLPWHVELSAPVTPVIAGFQGGWFHPVTGYSFPLALRVAEAIAATAAEHLPGPKLTALWHQHRRQLGFAMRLNWMLFRWFAPEQRYHVLERFYRLPLASIRNFYALQLTAMDRARLLIGRPPRGISWRVALSLSPTSTSLPSQRRTAKEPP
jgi:lycopene beta-cyclase